MANALEPLRRRLRRRERHGMMEPFERMQDEMERFFSDGLRGWPFMPSLFEETSRVGAFASVDLSETDDAVEVKIDVPGMEEKDIDLNLSEGALTVSGKRESQEEEKRKNYYRSERSYGAFTRRIPLPCEVDQDRVKAEMRNGVLTVNLPKSADAKRHERKIAIQSR